MIISPVFPERKSSAAGLRTWDMIRILQAAGHTVTVMSPGKDNEHAQAMREAGVGAEHCPPNSEAFDAAVKAFRPQIVLFDRFTMEEQFSWRVRRACPHAVLVLDTQDLHFLRRAREINFKKHGTMGGAPLKAGEAHLARELASIHRSDHVLLVSRHERALLTGTLGVAAHKLQICDFFYPAAAKEATIAPRESRQHFLAIGNFLHKPNVDSVLWLKTRLWPAIRQQLPHAELHVYGAHAKDKHMHLTDRKKGFLVKGYMEGEAVEAMAGYACLLAPLRFGAGIKGKIADAWCAGLPVVTTSVGAESMCDEADHADFGGLVADTEEGLVAAAVAMHSEEEGGALWTGAQARALALMRARYDHDANAAQLLHGLHQAVAGAVDRRKVDFVGAMLWDQTLRSSEYMSKYIQVKQKLEDAQQVPPSAN